MKRSAPLQRRTPLKRTGKSGLRRRVERDWTAARAKIEGECCCRNCGAFVLIDAAHTIAREHDDICSYDPRTNHQTPTFVVNPDSIIPLCRTCHTAYDRHEIDVLHLLNLAEQLDAVKRAGGLELARIRLCPSAYRQAA